MLLICNDNTFSVNREALQQRISLSGKITKVYAGGCKKKSKHAKMANKHQGTLFATVKTLIKVF